MSNMNHPAYKPKQTTKLKLNLNPKAMILNLVTKYVRPMLLNYKTTIAGVAMILHGASTIVNHLLAIANGEALNPDDLHLAGVEIVAGAGLIAARDADKSSQDSGVRK